MKSILKISMLLLLLPWSAEAADHVDLALKKPVVRLAELEIHAKDLEAYKKAVKEEIEESVRIEPGVVSIYSVAIKDKPNHLHFFEIYANDEAYRSHIASPHFKKYVEITKSMIKSRKLIETDSIQLSTKTHQPM